MINMIIKAKAFDLMFNGVLNKDLNNSEALGTH